MTKQRAIKSAQRYIAAKGGERAISQNKSWATRIANRWTHPFTGNIAPVAFQYAPKEA